MSLDVLRAAAVGWKGDARSAAMLNGMGGRRNSNSSSLYAYDVKTGLPRERCVSESVLKPNEERS